MNEEEPRKSKPWLWPGEWFEDEKFWRDVASRTTSGLLVLAIAYVFAVFWGYLDDPLPLPMVDVLKALTVALLITLWSWVVFRRISSRRKFPRGFILLQVVATIMMLFIMFSPDVRMALE